MKTYLSLTALWILLTTPCFGLGECRVNPTNQVALGLDFSITARKHERTFIVDFAIPPTSSLVNLTNVSLFTDTYKGFADASGFSVPFMGLTRLPRDVKTGPGQVEGVLGFRAWIGEDLIASITIRFEYEDKVYVIQLPDYVRQ